MNLSLSETIAVAHRWEKKAIEINAMMLSDSSAWVIKFVGRVSVSNDTIMLALDDDRLPGMGGDVTREVNAAFEKSGNAYEVTPRLLFLSFIIIPSIRFFMDF